MFKLMINVPFPYLRRSLRDIILQDTIQRKSLDDLQIRPYCTGNDNYNTLSDIIYYGNHIVKTMKLFRAMAVDVGWYIKENKNKFNTIGRDKFKYILKQ